MANRDPEKYKTYMRQYMKKRYAKRRALALDLLGGVCCRCGSTENLQVDHIDRLDKSYSFSRAVNLAEDAFRQEIAKCQGCHSRKTVEEDFGRDWARETHGTLSSYRYCRCPLCVAAHNKSLREYKRRKRASR